MTQLKNTGVLAVLSLALCAGLALGQRLDSLAADLVIRFQCKQLAEHGSTSESLESNFVLFLEEKRFRTVNISQLARKHGTWRSPLEIEALDDQERIIDVIDLTSSQGDIILRLITPPPTQRSPTLEKDLEAFVVGALGCQMSRVSRNENDPTAKPFHEREVMRIKQLLRDAEELQGKRRS